MEIVTRCVNSLAGITRHCGCRNYLIKNHVQSEIDSIVDGVVWIAAEKKWNINVVDIDAKSITRDEIEKKLHLQNPIGVEVYPADEPVQNQCGLLIMRNLSVADNAVFSTLRNIVANGLNGYLVLVFWDDENRIQQLDIHMRIGCQIVSFFPDGYVLTDGNYKAEKL